MIRKNALLTMLVCLTCSLALGLSVQSKQVHAYGVAEPLHTIRLAYTEKLTVPNDENQAEAEGGEGIEYETDSLTLNMKNGGTEFGGTLRHSDGTESTLSGTVKRGLITITSFSVSGRPSKIRVGRFDSAAGLYVGTVRDLDANRQEVGKGIWTAVPVENPDAVLVLDFSTVVNDNVSPDAASYQGALVLDKQKRTGTLNTADKHLWPVQAHINNNNIDLTITIGDGSIFAVGKSSLPEDKTEQYRVYQGYYVGPQDGVEGQWNAQSFPV